LTVHETTASLGYTHSIGRPPTRSEPDAQARVSRVDRVNR
jgi:hypothetical protein